MLGQRKTIGGILWVGWVVELKVIFHLPKASNVIGKKILLKVELSAISGTYQSIALKLLKSVHQIRSCGDVFFHFS